MSLEKIYNEIYLNLEDEYYVKLAESNVLVIPVLIDMMLEDSFLNAKWAQEILAQISNKLPKSVYPFFDYIAQALCNKNQFIRWNTWRIISNIVTVDVDEKWNAVSDKFFSALNSNLITEFSVACECADKIIASKPCEAERVLDIMRNIESRVFMLSGEISRASLDVAKEKVELFFERIIGCTQEDKEQ